MFGTFPFGTHAFGEAPVAPVQATVAGVLPALEGYAIGTTSRRAGGKPRKRKATRITVPAVSALPKLGAIHPTPVLGLARGTLPPFNGRLALLIEEPIPDEFIAGALILLADES